jgi:hypothetical protein
MMTGPAGAATTVHGLSVTSMVIVTVTAAPGNITARNIVIAADISGMVCGFRASEL